MAGESQQAFAEVREIFDDPMSHARTLKAQGHLLVGLLASVVPEEVVLAAGAVPHRVIPHLDAPTPVADTVLNPDEDPVLRSLLQQLAEDAHDILSLGIIGPPHSQVSTMLEDLRRSGRLPNAVPGYYFEMLARISDANRAYARERTRSLSARMTALTGIEPSDERLVEAIASTNKRRAAMADFVANCRDRRCISGADAFRLLATHGYMRSEDYVAKLRQATAELEPLPELQKMPGVLLIPSGPLTTVDAHLAIEEAGAIVVAEDDPSGSRATIEPIAASADPLDAIADYHFENQSGLRTYPAERRLAWFEQQATRNDVTGVIYYLESPRFGWDFPRMDKYLASIGKRSLIVRADARSPEGKAAVRDAVEPFAKSLHRKEAAR